MESNKSVDLYIHDINLAIEMDGPPHFFSNTGERKVSLQDLKTDREIGPLRLSYRLFKRFFDSHVDFTALREEDFSEVKRELRDIIDEHQEARK